jgi:hypothetical protein
MEDLNEYESAMYEFLKTFKSLKHPPKLMKYTDLNMYDKWYNYTFLYFLDRGVKGPYQGSVSFPIQCKISIDLPCSYNQLNQDKINSLLGWNALLPETSDA